jgi:murein DD-endopeptidase MepM/ murein hydrolase activator NlpD
VLAAGAGRVGYAGLLAGRGVVVVVHGELRTTYEPVVAEVAVGSAVAAGERIGTLEPGHAGCPAAACLHWGLRRGDSYLDPLRLVDRGPVRLLPLAARSGSVAAAPAPAAAPRAAAPADPVARAPLQPAAPQDTRWSLRRADAPLGAGALAALVAGLALVASARRPPRRPPDGPAAAGAAARPSLPDGDSPGPPVEPAPVPGRAASRDAPVDLDSERVRRRAAS